LAWTIEYARTAREQLRKLDKTIARRIADYLDNRIAALENPRDAGKALTGKLQGCWRYRVGDYRIVCSIEDGRLVVLVLEIGHRREIYR
jgi:mRNA interferase RelE/StbE